MFCTTQLQNPLLPAPARQEGMQWVIERSCLRYWILRIRKDSVVPGHEHSLPYCPSALVRHLASWDRAFDFSLSLSFSV
jgi:hypothetical protein